MRFKNECGSFAHGGEASLTLVRVHTRDAIKGEYAVECEHVQDSRLFRHSRSGIAEHAARI